MYEFSAASYETTRCYKPEDSLFTQTAARNSDVTRS